MNNTDTLEKVELSGVDMGDSFAVEAFNNGSTTFDEVINTLKTVCGYDQEKAMGFAQIIHREGKALVFFGAEAKCMFLIKAFKNILVRSELIEWKN